MFVNMRETITKFKNNHDAWPTQVEELLSHSLPLVLCRMIVHYAHENLFVEHRLCCHTFLHHQDQKSFHFHFDSFPMTRVVVVKNKQKVTKSQSKFPYMAKVIIDSLTVTPNVKFQWFIQTRISSPRTCAITQWFNPLDQHEAPSPPPVPFNIIRENPGQGIILHHKHVESPTV